MSVPRKIFWFREENYKQISNILGKLNILPQILYQNTNNLREYKKVQVTFKFVRDLNEM